MSSEGKLSETVLFNLRHLKKTVLLTERICDNCHMLSNNWLIIGNCHELICQKCMHPDELKCPKCKTEFTNSFVTNHELLKKYEILENCLLSHIIIINSINSRFNNTGQTHSTCIITEDSNMESVNQIVIKNSLSSSKTKEDTHNMHITEDTNRDITFRNSEDYSRTKETQNITLVDNSFITDVIEVINSESLSKTKTHNNDIDNNKDIANGITIRNSKSYSRTEEMHNRNNTRDSNMESVNEIVIRNSENSNIINEKYNKHIITEDINKDITYETLIKNSEGCSYTCQAHQHILEHSNKDTVIGNSKDSSKIEKTHNRHITKDSIVDTADLIVINNFARFNKTVHTGQHIAIDYDNMNDGDLNVIENFADEFDVEIYTKWNDSITHLIIKTDSNNRCNRTKLYYDALVSHRYIVSFEWAKKCLATKFWLPELNYVPVDKSSLPSPLTSWQVGRGIIDSPLEWSKNCMLFFHSSVKLKENCWSWAKKAGFKVVDEINKLKGEFNMRFIIVEQSANSMENYMNWIKVFKAIPIHLNWFFECLGQYRFILISPHYQVMMLKSDMIELTNINQCYFLLSND